MESMPSNARTWREAEKLGLDRYYTGKPCSRGHIAERYMRTCICVECAKEHNVANRGKPKPPMTEARRARLRATSLAWKRKNAERNKAITLAWRTANPEASRASAMNWKARNIERMKAKAAAYAKAHAAYYAAMTRARDAAKLQRTPPWVEMAAIRAIYEACPPGMEVDHIIPLRGKTVSGLHVPWNLQYLTKTENSRKNNRFECS